jgi:diguanylate cyclase (GGDEF)-like protein
MTSSSTRSSRASGPAGAAPLEPPSPSADPADLHLAVVQARAVDQSRARVAAGARTGLRPHAATILAVLYSAALGVWLLASPPTAVPLAAVAWSVAMIAVASAIEFEIGPGAVVPTAPVLVVCLFVVPPQLVPLVVTAGWLLSSVVRHALQPGRREHAPVVIGSTVHALGPALVFFVAGAGAPTVADWPVYALASLAQLVFDAFSSWYLNCFRLGVTRRELTSALRFTYFVDLLLFPIGYIVALVAPASPLGLVLLVPLLVLLSILQRDRTRQLDVAIALATHDPLTGLANRTLFYERLEDALAEEWQIAVLLIDLDRFKEVNDTLGHAFGDEVLVEVGDRLRPRLATSEMIARLGGDEFAVLIEATDETQALQRVDELLGYLRAPFGVGGLDFDLDASIGIAMASGPELTAADLLRRADVAMYTAKEDHAGRALYAAHRDQYSAERLALGGQLRRGIADGELELHYQPQVDLRTNRVVGVEALIRWNHPVRGLISPQEFIPVAERTELIRPLTSLVFTNAIAAATEWRRAGHELKMSVNLSPRNLAEDDLVESIAGALAMSELPPSSLVVELTETTVMASSRRAAEVMHRLRAIGVQISIDDFGTGYSSLAYLTALPSDQLKVDKSFIRAMSTDRNAATVVRTIVDLARSLRLDVVAEGVETEGEARLLAAVGCRTAQGYLFGRPMPAAEMTSWLAQHDASLSSIARDADLQLVAAEFPSS